MLPIYALRLKQARTKAKVTQIELQRLTGINNKTLSGYENGISEPDYETLKQLCDFYGVTTDWVLGHTNNPHSKLEPAERELVQNIDFADDTLIDVPMFLDGRELTGAEKQKVLAMARLLLQQDR